MQRKSKIRRDARRRVVHPRRLAVEPLEARQLLSLPPGLPASVAGPALRMELAVVETVPEAWGPAFPGDIPGGRVRATSSAAKASPGPVSAFDPGPWSYFNGFPPAAVGRAASETFGNSPYAASARDGLPLARGREVVIVVVVVMAGSPGPMTTAERHAPGQVTPTLLAPANDPAILSLGTDLTSLAPKLTRNPEASTGAIDYRTAANASSLPISPASTEPGEGARTLPLSWPVASRDRLFSTTMDAVRTEVGTDRISPYAEEGFVELQPSKLRGAASQPASSDDWTGSPSRERRTTARSSLTPLGVDWSWRRLTLLDEQPESDLAAFPLDALAGSDGWSHVDLALPPEILESRRLALSPVFEEDGMVVIESPRASAFQVADSPREIVAVNNDSPVFLPGVGNGVRMDAVCGQLHALEVFGTRSMPSPSTIDHEASSEPAGAAAVELIDSATAPTVSAAAAGDESSGLDSNQAAVLPLLLALLPQWLLARRRRQVVVASEAGPAAPRSRLGFLGLLRQIIGCH